jgi:hypothetical protein
MEQDLKGHQEAQEVLEVVVVMQQELLALQVKVMQLELVDQTQVEVVVVLAL